MTIHLFTFNCANKYWHYTNGKKPIFLGGNKHIPLAIARGRWKTEMDNSDFEITIPSNTELTSLFIKRNPIRPVFVKIKNTNGNVILSGVILESSTEAQKRISKLKCQSIKTIVSGHLPTRRFSPSCPWILYGADCGLSKSDFVYEVSRDDCTINDTSIITDLSSYAAGYFSFGFIECGHETILIVNHSGDELTLLNSFFDDYEEETFRIYPGCDLTKSTCENKFSNLSNFGGFPFIPIRNPVTEGV